MAENKIIQTRIANKHDLEANWQKAVNFVPLRGETIIYDAEVDADGRALALPEGRTVPYTYARMKLGDGVTLVGDLPFIADPANITTGLGLKTTQTDTRVSIDIDDDVTFIFDAGTAADFIAAIPERLEGDGQEFYTMAPSTLSFRSTAPLNELQDVQINGQTVDPSNYELEEGSTIVKLKYDYLSTLNVGQYELSIVSDSKTAKGDFTVAAPELNEYGFYYNQPYSVKTAINEELITYTVWFKEDYVYGLTKNSRESATYQYENGIISFNLSFPGGNYYCLSFTGSFSDNGRQIGGTGNFLSNSTETTDIVLEMSAQMACADDMYMYVKHNDNSISYFPLYNRAIFYYPLPKTNILGFPITSLYEGAFNGSDVNTVLLPDSLTSISDFAFYNCANLRSITIPSSVTSIGDKAFYDCGYLWEIVIPNGVTTIGNYAFYKAMLETVTIPNSLTSLGDKAFNICMKLLTVNYDGTVEQAKTVLASLLSTHWKDIGTYTVYCTDGTINNHGTVTMY
jgi:hypothetical protein